MLTLIGYYDSLAPLPGFVVLIGQKRFLILFECRFPPSEVEPQVVRLVFVYDLPYLRFPVLEELFGFRKSWAAG